MLLSAKNNPDHADRLTGLSSTGVLTVRDANRRIGTRKAHEINKDWQRVGEEIDREVAQWG